MRTPIAGLAALTLGLLLAPAAGAVSPRTWRTTGVESWTAADRESVGVTSEGAVGLSLASVPAEGLDAAMVWDLLPDGGDLLVATGDGGAVYRVTSGGKATVEASVVQPEVTCLGRDGRGRVLLGTSPDGMIYRLEGKKAVPVVDTPETYIWRILPLSGEDALVATGDSGKLYRLKGRGEIELFADLGAVNVTALVPRRDGWLATTESPGRLLEVDGDGTFRVLYDAAEPELRAPVVAADGTVFFLANPPGDSGEGRLYRRTPQGGVERVWTSLDGFAYDLLAAGDGALWVTTGSDSGGGSVVRVTPGPPSSWMEMVKVAEPRVMTAAVSHGALDWIGTGGAGRVYRIPSADAGRGTVTVEPFDAGGTARWGALTLEPGLRLDSVSAEVRSGNTRTPDDTWSAWRRVELTGGRGPVGERASRFLQWRLSLTDPGARVDGVGVVYLPANLAPQVNEVTVSELGAEYLRSWDRSQPASLSQDLAGGVHVEFQVPGNRGNTPATDEEAAWARRYRAVTWKADDPNDDELRYTLAVRAGEETVWKPLDGDLESSPWIWDTATVPDGWYVLRVTASDRDANPPAEADSAARTTEPFLVDNTAPVISDLRVAGGVLTGVAVDATSPIKKLEMAVDGRSWTVVFPEDGIADMPRETLRVALPDLPSGEHAILVRAYDDAGNPGLGRVGFTLP